MKKDRKDEPYVLMVREGGRGRWRRRRTAEYPHPLFVATAGLRGSGHGAKVMHGDVEVGVAPGPVF